MAGITHYRLTFVWTESTLDAVTGRISAASAPLPEAVAREAYKRHFDRAQSTWPAPSEPSPPWPPSRLQGFWARYLGVDESLKSVSGGAAWRSLVPLRIADPLALDAAVGDVRVRSEGLVHPWGVCFLLTIAASPSQGDFTALTDRLIRSRRERWLRCVGDDVSIDEAGSRGLDALAKRVFGTLNGPRHRRPEPFSIFTPVRGEGSRQELDPAGNEDLHRLVQAAASFSSTWDWDDLVELDKSRVARRKQQPSSHVIFGTTRGRSIWAPKYLSINHPKHTLTCQHRNLVFASSQVESLAGLAEVVTAESGNGSLGGNLDFFCRRAMAQLGALYLGSPSTYRTGSVKAQIDANAWLSPINALRNELDLQAL